MPNHDPRAIVNEFLLLGSDDIGTQRAQILSYLAHGWSLAVNGQPLVRGGFLAGDAGPFSPEVKKHIDEIGKDPVDGALLDESGLIIWAKLDSEENSLISKVWTKYGKRSTRELVNTYAHEGTPWSNAYYGEGRNAEITEQSTTDYFVRLALAGRKRLTFEIEGEDSCAITP